MRLEREHHPAVWVTLSHGLQGCRDLGRMVTVVIDNRNTTRRCFDVGDMLQPSIDALESRQRALDRRVIDPELSRHGDCGKRIENVVRPREVHGDLERRRRSSQDIERGLQPLASDVLGSYVRGLAQSVAQNRPANAAQDAFDVHIIQTQHGQPIERQVVEELHEALLEKLEISAVRNKVIVVDVCDDRDERLKVRK